MLLYFILMAGIVILDQITKFFAASRLPYGETVRFVHPILDFHYHQNRGAAWGILADHPWVFMAFSTIAVIVIIAFFVLYRKKQIHPLIKIGFALIAGGGIGNLIDRFAQGYVVDFLEFGFFDFPIFNVADSFVTIGAILVILYLILDTVKDHRKKKDSAPNDNDVKSDA